MWRAIVSSGLVLAGCGFRAGGKEPVNDATGTDGPADVAIDVPSPDGPRTDWWDTAWRHRVKITIDNTKLTGTLPLDDFRVLVTLPPAVAVGTGASLRFVSIDNTTVYTHELDTVMAGGNTWAWVLMPMLSPTGPKPTLWAYYNNSAATSTSNGPAVWNARHTSVHHLTTLEDATGAGHTGSASGNPAVVAGQIGSARSFDGDDYIELAGENNYDFTTAMYVSAWIKVNVFDAPYQAIVTKGDSSWRLHRSDQANGAGFGTTSGTTNHNLNGSKSVNNGQWHMVAGVLDGTTKFLYVDGALDESSANSLQLDNNQFLVRLGQNPESQVGGPRYWEGLIDEVRISAGPRSANWILAEYITGSDPTFVTAGPPEPY